MGMTYDQYWHDDPSLAKFYKKAKELIRAEKNAEAWRQGCYIYDALCCVAPILNAFSKETTPHKYHDAPYPLTKKEAEEAEDRRAKAEMEASKATLMAKTAIWKSQQLKKEAVENG